MAKITRVTQKIFGSQASPNEIAQFGSFAAGSPVLLSPGSPAAIQTLPQYLQGWFASVVNGAAPAIEDMNALQYLNSYQLAYLLQQGVAEYDGSTTYFIGSIVNSAGILYASLTDNNLGNPVTDTGNWRVLVAGAYPDGTVLSGTYDGDVYVLGDASIDTLTTITGDLIVVGDLSYAGSGSGLFVFGNLVAGNDFTNSVGAGLDVLQDCYVGGTFNFTPASLLTAQNNVWIRGNFNYGAATGNTAEMKVNPGQGPFLEVDGAFYSSFAAGFDGSGQSEANGLTLFLGMNLFYINTLTLDGGDSIGTAPGGAGGQVFLGGHAPNSAMVFSAKGGAGSGIFPGGNGGLFSAQNAVDIGSGDVSGGSTSGSGDGGAAGTISTTSDHLSATGALLLKGGDSVGGNGGAGGQLTVTNGILLVSTPPDISAGSGGTPGPAGSITITGNETVGALGISNSVAATTPGSVVKKIEVFDQYGASLGFVPVYDTIT